MTASRRGLRPKSCQCPWRPIAASSPQRLLRCRGPANPTQHPEPWIAYKSTSAKPNTHIRARTSDIPTWIGSDGRQVQGRNGFQRGGVFQCFQTLQQFLGGTHGAVVQLLPHRVLSIGSFARKQQRRYTHTRAYNKSLSVSLTCFITSSRQRRRTWLWIWRSFHHYPGSSQQSPP